jgi:hypothetical protein
MKKRHKAQAKQKPKGKVMQRLQKGNSKRQDKYTLQKRQVIKGKVSRQSTRQMHNKETENWTSGTRYK